MEKPEEGQKKGAAPTERDRKQHPSSNWRLINYSYPTEATIQG